MDNKKSSERGSGEKQELDTEELRLRDKTLANTPSDKDEPKTETGIYAPEGSGYGMSPVSGEDSSKSHSKEGSNVERKPAGSERKMVEGDKEWSGRSSTSSGSQGKERE